LCGATVWSGATASSRITRRSKLRHFSQETTLRTVARNR
jgi:hypothetical protein